jgi:ABC-type molybdate transport system substrate-binding protein
VTSTLPRVLALVFAASLSLATRAADLTVSAAASVTNAFQELAPLFEAANPGTGLQACRKTKSPLSPIGKVACGQ